MNTTRVQQAIRYLNAEFHTDGWHYRSPDGRLLCIDLDGLEHLGDALAERYSEWHAGYVIEGEPDEPTIVENARTFTVDFL